MAKKRRKPHRSAATNEARTATTTQERPRSTKAEHKELARHQREQARKRMARRRFVRLYLILLGVSTVVALGIFLVARPKTQAGPLPGILLDRAPWSANTQQVGDRLSRLGLPAAGGALHIHANVQVFVAGTQEPVPSDIGIAPGVESPLHTHDTSGVIHIESASSGFQATLGEFFDVWGVRLSSTCMGGYCDSGDRQLRAYVNGKEVTGDPRDVQLKDHDVVVLTFGAANEQPKPIPSTYDWSTLVP
ncbi:MAG TPA: hypothetical protein VF984_11565 [Actinomycetota bacterium]